MEMKNSCSPFCGRSDGVVLTSSYVPQGDIVEYYDKPTIVYPDPKDKEIFFVDKVSTEMSRKDRQKYMDSFAGDVGVLNIVKKLAMQGENAADGRFAVPEDSYMDMTAIPQSKEEYDALMAEKNKIWASLDPELKGTMSFEEFCASFNDEKLKAYVDSKVSAVTENTADDKGGQE